MQSQSELFIDDVSCTMSENKVEVKKVMFFSTLNKKNLDQTITPRELKSWNSDHNGSTKNTGNTILNFLAIFLDIEQKHEFSSHSQNRLII